MITPAIWMTIQKDIREKMREIFKIPKSSFIEVVDGKVKSDGIMGKDLEVLTDEKLQDYSGISGTSTQMLDECVKRLLEPPTAEEIEEATEEAIKEPIETQIIANNDGFKCELCEFQGKNQRSLRMHNMKKHK